MPATVHAGRRRQGAAGAMRYRPLGRTGLEVSAIALGTVELGLAYGVGAQGTTSPPSEEEASRLLHHAADAGITLFDTAPTYGESERLLGRALGKRRDCLFATKISLPPAFAAEAAPGVLRRAIEASLQASRRALQRDVLDLVQLHNATEAAITRGAVAEVLLEARRRGEVRFLGVTVYGERAALAALSAGYVDVIQVAYSLLDQRMAARVLPQAAAAGVGVLGRSALLKGALTPRAQWLPPELTPLREAARQVCRAYDISWAQLPRLALRFCLAAPQLSAVLVGARTIEELDQALAAAAAGPLSAAEVSLAQDLGLSDERLVNPTFWPVP